MITKSQNSFSTAQFLLDEDVDIYRAAIIHCSYYSCIQRMIHILEEQFQITDVFIKAETIRLKKGSHEIMADKIFDILNSISTDKIDVDNYYRAIKALKKSRIKADYSKTKIEKNESELMLQNSEKVIKILSARFNI